jgi:hypothetical protein
MGLRSRDSIARANTATNEKNARRGLSAVKTRFVKTTSTKATAVEMTTMPTTEATTSEVASDGARRSSTGRRRRDRVAHIRWQDEASEDAPRDEEERNDPSTSGRDENRRKRPLEMTIEYTPSESEEGEGGMFARLPSQGAGANAGLYEYEDDSDSSDDDVRHPRARDDAPSCCCVIT